MCRMRHSSRFSQIVSTAAAVDRPCAPYAAATFLRPIMSQNRTGFGNLIPVTVYDSTHWKSKVSGRDEPHASKDEIAELSASQLVVSRMSGLYAVGQADPSLRSGIPFNYDLVTHRPSFEFYRPLFIIHHHDPFFISIFQHQESGFIVQLFTIYH